MAYTKALKHYDPDTTCIWEAVIRGYMRYSEIFVSACSGRRVKWSYHQVQMTNNTHFHFMVVIIRKLTDGFYRVLIKVLFNITGFLDSSLSSAILKELENTSPEDKNRPCLKTL
jgi:hypothetical protein